MPPASILLSVRCRLTPIPRDAFKWKDFNETCHKQSSFEWELLKRFSRSWGQRSRLGSDGHESCDLGSLWTAEGIWGRKKRTQIRVAGRRNDYLFKVKGWKVKVTETYTQAYRRSAAEDRLLYCFRSVYITQPLTCVQAAVYHDTSRLLQWRSQWLFDARKHNVQTECLAATRQHCYFAVNSSVIEELA